MPQGDELRCLRCGYTWHQGGANPPKVCGACKSQQEEATP